MAKSKFLDAADAIKFLGRNGIQTGDRKITLKKGSVGLNCWGAIDYLCNYCNFHVQRGQSL